MSIVRASFALFGVDARAKQDAAVKFDTELLDYSREVSVSVHKSRSADSVVFIPPRSVLEIILSFRFPVVDSRLLCNINLVPRTAYSAAV